MRIISSLRDLHLILMKFPSTLLRCSISAVQLNCSIIHSVCEELLSRLGSGARARIEARIKSHYPLARS